MVYSIIAELVFVLHFAFIFFSVLGGILVIWKKWLIYIHIPAAIWGSLIVIMGWRCPLTPLENYFRLAGGSEGYTGGFISHYIAPIIYPEGLTRELQVNLGITAIVINLLIYAYVIYQRRESN